MKTTPIPDQAVLHELLDYDLITGKLYWRERPLDTFSMRSRGLVWNKRFAGKEALTSLRSDGYLAGAINYVNYLAHRVIFKYLHGYDPDQVDHDDRNRQNNRANNLVDASATQNSRNSKMYSTNSSGHTGVYWNKRDNKWLAAITVNRININLGSFDDIRDAITARNNAEITHRFHPNHGK